MARCSSQSRDLGPYLSALNKAEFVWMDGTEVGMTNLRPHAILLWPYKYRTVGELMGGITHEIVHRVKGAPFEQNDPAVEAIKTALIRDIWWVSAVYLRIAREYHAAIKKMRKVLGVSVDVDFWPRAQWAALLQKAQRRLKVPHGDDD